jgi:murein L,D-transpeptidase YcbB/YkuD
VWAAGDRLTARAALPAFYRGRDFRPAWIRSGRPGPEVDRLVAAIEGASLDGLDPDAYHLEAIGALIGRGGRLETTSLVDLDLLATDAFLVLGSHLLHGRVDPARVRAEWLADRRGADMAAVLAAALEDGDVADALDALRQPQPGYRAMREALGRLREAQASGGWPPVEAGPTLRVGDVGPRVAALRRRLGASGDLPGGGDAGSPDVFDATLEAAVRSFQERHGLEVDGAAGRATVETLNVPVSERIERLVVNLERWRWMPAELGRRHILVNIPDFAVAVREEGATVLRMRAIVGRHYRQTPVFSGRMTHLVLSPYWHVPPGIAAADKLPLIRQDPSYLRAQRMTLLDLRDNRPVDPASVDWSALTGAEFNRRYRLRQDPGPLNALGRVKFMFPNPYNVYLHDTPSRELFGQVERSFSSGCIRVERPLELAGYLLRDDPAWLPERIARAAEATSETVVNLREPVPVHLQYWTAFVDGEGRLNFRRDLYARDDAVIAALEAPPPGE